MLKNRLCWAALLLALTATPLWAAPKKIVLHVKAPAVAWADSQVEDAIVVHFTRDREFQITRHSGYDPLAPEFPKALYDLDSLINWGNEIGGRYLLLVDITSERLDKKRTFHIPLILHRYESMGVIEAEVRLLDLERGRLLLAEPLLTELSARKVIQADPDKDKYDADTHLPASEKSAFFSKLERQFTEDLYDRVKRALLYR